MTQAIPTWDLAVRATGFHRHTAELSRTNLWTSRLGWTVPYVYDTIEAEHAALRSACAISDRTPLAVYAVSGRDAAAFLDRAAGGCGGNVAVGASRRVVLCDDDGALIADGLVQRPGRDEWLLTLPLRLRDHLEASAIGFSVEIADLMQTTACLAVEGPSACAALLSSGLGGIEALRPGGVRRMKLGLTEVTIARVTPTGGLGYELRIAADDADWLWGRIRRGGEAFNMRPAGEAALDLARLEAGHPRCGIDYTSALDAAPAERRSPFSLGLASLVALDGQPFTGRRALLEERSRGASRALVGVVSHDPEVAGGQAGDCPGRYRRAAARHVPGSCARDCGQAQVRGPDRAPPLCRAPQRPPDPARRDVKNFARRDGPVPRQRSTR